MTGVQTCALPISSEVFLPFVAARTQQIHVGSAIWNLTPPVNPPARTAERVAMMDHLSEGRFEFGTGRGSSSTEFKGFGIPDGDTTRAMYDEALPQILRMWKEERYSYDGRFFAMPGRRGRLGGVEPLLRRRCRCRCSLPA